MATRAKAAMARVGGRGRVVMRRRNPVLANQGSVSRAPVDVVVWKWPTEVCGSGEPGLRLVRREVVDRVVRGVAKDLVMGWGDG